MTEEVRLKGFSRRAPLADFLSWIDAQVTPLGTERVPFRDAYDRILAQDVLSKVSVPSFRRAAMDGYAIRAHDVPGTLALRGELMAADSARAPVGPGEAMRVMTGARIPDGADAVVMVEHAKLDQERVDIASATTPGKHILRVGEDIEAGKPVLERGRRLRPQDLAMLVQAGALEVTVRRRPQVMILPTGTELLPTGERAEGSQVVESNSFMLQALARRDGAEAYLHPIAPDDREQMKAIMQSCRADVLVVSGGSSVGKEDLAPVVANEVGEVAIHGLALKPASSTGIGRIGNTIVVLGPGYPVAAYVAWDLVVRPVINRLLDTPDRWPYEVVTAVLDAPYPKRRGRIEVVRVVLNDDEPPLATVLPGGSAILSTLTAGDGFLCLPEELGPLAAGDPVDVHLYR